MQRPSPPPDAPVVLRSPHRVVTPEHAAYIRAVMAAHPEWGRQALSLHLCQAWAWRRPDGTWNHRACRHLLRRLADQGTLTLPPRQSTPERRRSPPPSAAPPPTFDAPGTPRVLSLI